MIRALMEGHAFMGCKLLGAFASMLMVVGCNTSPGLMPQVQSMAQAAPQAAAASQKTQRFNGHLYFVRYAADNKPNTKLIAVRQNGTTQSSNALFVVSPQTEVVYFDGHETEPLNTTGLLLASPMAVIVETAGPIRKLERNAPDPVSNTAARQAEATANQAVKVTVLRHSSMFKTYKPN